MIRQPSEFAIFGGQPQFTDPLVVGRPNDLDRDSFLRRITCVLDSGQLTNGGPMVKEFEQQLADCLGVRHVIAVSSGTVALQVMAMACELSGEVIVPSMTFIATAHALQWMGLTPVFADIDPETHGLDPESVARCVSPRTAAILGVHLWGNPCDADALQQVADQNELDLLFDASHAFGCSYGRRKVGSLGKAEAFSFHATKVMHSVEGGAVTTNDDHIAHRCRLIRNFGISGLTQIECLGVNAKMSELSAAAGLTSLENLPQLIAHNLKNLQTYRRALNGIRGVQVAIPESESDDDLNGQYVVVRVDEDAFGLSRDLLLDVLRAEGVFARAYFVPGCHNAPPYADNRRHVPVSLPVTDLLLQEVLQLPTGGFVTAAEIQHIAALLIDVQRHASAIREQTRLTEVSWHPLDPARPVTTSRQDAA